MFGATFFVGLPRVMNINRPPLLPTETGTARGTYESLDLDAMLSQPDETPLMSPSPLRAAPNSRSPESPRLPIGCMTPSDQKSSWSLGSTDCGKKLDWHAYNDALERLSCIRPMLPTALPETEADSEDYAAAKPQDLSFTHLFRDERWDDLRIGCMIKLHGLARDAEFNGLTATVVGFRADNKVIAKFNTVVRSSKIKAGRPFCVHRRFCAVGHRETPTDGRKAVEELKEFLCSPRVVEEDGTGGVNIRDTPDTPTGSVNLTRI